MMEVNTSQNPIGQSNPNENKYQKEPKTEPIELEPIEEEPIVLEPKEEEPEQVEEEVFDPRDDQIQAMETDLGTLLAQFSQLFMEKKKIADDLMELEMKDNQNLAVLNSPSEVINQVFKLQPKLSPLVYSGFILCSFCTMEYISYD